MINARARSREYAKRYREEGYGRNADARYRAKHADIIRAKDKQRKREKRMKKSHTPPP